MEKQKQDDRYEVCTKAVRAGKRTYYFDVKKTRNDDYYLTITESKRKSDEFDNVKSFEKHKIFLYKEDFEKFFNGLSESISCIKELQKTGNVPENFNGQSSDFDKIDFDSI